MLLASVPALAWIGFRAVLETTDGQAVDPELDPNEPGYEAFLDPTPVAMVAGVDAEGALSWLTVLALGGPAEQGGAVLFVPVGTVVDHPDLGEVTLAEVWAQTGRFGLSPAVASVLGVGFTEDVVLEHDRVAALLAPVAPLTVAINDELPGFDTGEVELDGEAFAGLLEVRAEGESDLARLARHEDVWRAWLAAVAASTDPDAVPGERGSGMGRYVRGVAAGAVSFDVVPTTPIDVEDEEAERFEVDADAAYALVAERIPFPVAATPGARLRVRVLDGVGADGLALRAARDVVRAGGQVTVVGNGDRFDADVSRLVYFDQTLADEVADVAELLGVDDVQREDGPNPNDLVDLTLVVGSDLAGAYGLFVDVGIEQPVDLAITHLELPTLPNGQQRQLFDNDERLVLRALVQATGKDLSTTLVAHLDKKTFPQPVEVKAGQKQTVPFELDLNDLKPGLHQMEVRVDPPDLLPFNNRRFVTFAIRQPRKVLVLTANGDENVYLSGRNLPAVEVMPYPQASAYDVLWSEAVVLEEGALTGVMPEPLPDEPEPEAEAERPRRRAPASAKKSTAKPAAKARAKSAKAAKAAKKSATKAAKKARPAKKSAAKPAKKAKAAPKTPKKKGKK